MNSLAPQPPTAAPNDAAPRRPVRVLHVLRRMNRGGVETWLMNVLRAAGRDAVRMDFLVGSEEPGAYDDEIRRLGSNVIPCPSPNPLAFAGNFRRAVGAHGPYDVVHSHVYAYSGWVLKQAARAGVPVRIAHVHSDRSSAPSEATLRRRVYRSLMRRLVERYATAGAGISEATTAAFFGKEWRRDPRWRVVYCGIDVGRFRDRPDAGAVRDELGLPRDAMVAGHVGSLAPVKNHALLLSMTASLVERRPPGAPPVRLLLVGDGPLREELGAAAIDLGVRDVAVFAGSRPDVPRMLAAMDVFAFPSLWEGVPLSVVEAQAAGLPIVLSDRVTTESVVMPELVRRLAPTAPPAAWADACLAAYAGRDAVPRERAAACVEVGRFNMDACLRELMSLYSAAGRVVAAERT